ncbi:MAG: TldD/PmbA family protein [Prevotellaceae bacterium]|jgi:TldD protein|nr:TldD/PmbA family protein [Prevotellaceae bacterium]
MQQPPFLPPQPSAMLRHFGVTLDDLKKALAAALEKGADYADLFFEHSFENYLSLRDGTVNRASADVDYGVGVRAVKGDQTGYAYVESTNLDDMLNAARTASCIARSGQTRLGGEIKTDVRFPQTRILTSWEDVAVKSKIPYVQTLNDRIFALDRRISKVSVSLNDTTTYVLFCNSEGLCYADYRPMAILTAVCVMEQNGQIENGQASVSQQKGFEFLTDDLLADLAQNVVRKTAVLFDAVKPRGGEMPVVMAAGSSGILLHEAIGHAFEADFNRKNESIFSDKLGKQVCDARITVVDDGTLPYSRGAVNVDDEGVAGQKTCIVTHGVLTSYLHDRISARYYGVAPTGNGRRQSFRHAPLPRMRVTYMENGDADEQDIIAAVKNGVYVDNFTNGQVQIGAGDFTFFVKSGYLIENGKLTQPIKDINIIGNGPQALADITMVGNNCRIDAGAWTCGKNGQSMPVSQGLPSVLVKKLTVGGES